MAEPNVISEYENSVRYLSTSISERHIKNAYRDFRKFGVLMPEEVTSLPQFDSVERNFQNLLQHTGFFFRRFNTNKILGEIVADSGTLIGKAKGYFSGIQQENDRLRRSLENYKKQTTELQEEITKLKQKEMEEFSVYSIFPYEPLLGLYRIDYFTHENERVMTKILPEIKITGELIQRTGDPNSVGSVLLEIVESLKREGREGTGISSKIRYQELVKVKPVYGDRLSETIGNGIAYYEKELADMKSTPAFKKL